MSLTRRPSRAPFDFDGDGRTDVSMFRPSNGVWYLQRLSAGFTAVLFGAATDSIALADYDGDGKTDIAVFRPSNGTWYVLNSSTSTFTGVQFGQAGDLPRPADFDGDNKADISIFRPSNGVWYRLNSTNGQFVFNAFGQTYSSNTQSGSPFIQFGKSSDNPVPALTSSDNKRGQRNGRLNFSFPKKCERQVSRLPFSFKAKRSCYNFQKTSDRKFLKL